VSVAILFHDPADPRTPGALRNRALATATADLACYAIDPPRGPFLNAAAAILDGDPEIAFVTGGGDATHPATIAALCGRSWFSHVPTVYRRSSILAAGGFDETLDGAEELELLLRLLQDGARGLVVDEPARYHRAWGPSPAPNSGEPFARAGRQLFEKHRALFDAHAASILVARERTARQLIDRIARIAMLKKG
jgi:hypothetical protein